MLALFLSINLFNPVVPNAPFLNEPFPNAPIPSFQGLEQGFIGNEWVKLF